jgi:hypothetical protein
MAIMQLGHIELFNAVISSLVFNHAFQSPSRVYIFIDHSLKRSLLFCFVDERADDGLERAKITFSLSRDGAAVIRDNIRVELSDDLRYVQNGSVMNNRNLQVLHSLKICLFPACTFTHIEVTLVYCLCNIA